MRPASAEGVELRCFPLCARLRSPKETVGELFTVVCKNGADRIGQAAPGPSESDARSPGSLVV